jgi:hypothetical protein
MANRTRWPIISVMKPQKPYRRYVLVDRRVERPGVRRMSVARLVGVVEIASTGTRIAQKPAL